MVNTATIEGASSLNTGGCGGGGLADLPKSFTPRSSSEVLMECKATIVEGTGAGGARLEAAGSVAAEFALVAPMLVLIAAGIADFGLLATRSAALVAATRIGAEYARTIRLIRPASRAQCKARSSRSPALSFPVSFPRTCECDDGTAISCTESCAALGRPGPNRLSIRISASQASLLLCPGQGFRRA